MINMKFRWNKGLEMIKDGEVWFSFGRNEKGTRTSEIQRLRSRREIGYRKMKFTTAKVPKQGGGFVEYVFGKRK